MNVPYLLGAPAVVVAVAASISRHQYVRDNL